MSALIGWLPYLAVSAVALGMLLFVCLMGRAARFIWRVGRQVQGEGSTAQGTPDVGFNGHAAWFMCGDVPLFIPRSHNHE